MSRRVVEQIGLFYLLMSIGCSSMGQPPAVALPKLPNLSLPSFRRTHNEVIEESLPPEIDSETPRREPLVAEVEADSAPPPETVSPHDPATQQLIAAELQQVPEAERDELLAYLNSLESTLVPYILQARQLERGESSQVAETEQHAEIQTVKHEDRARVTDPSPADSAAPDTEPDDGLKAPDPAPTESLQGRLKALTDPNAIWPMRDRKTDQAANDYNPLRFPKILGAGEKEPVVHPPSVPTLEHSLAAETNGGANNPPPAIKQSPVLRLPRGSEHWEEELQKLISLLEAETAAQSPREVAVRADVRKQVALRMLYVIIDETQLAQQPIPGISNDEQEFWTAMFWGLSDYLTEKSTTAPGERAASVASHLRNAAFHLQQTSKLELQNLAFCERIDGFGMYTPFDANQFTAGQPVLLYCEVKNFKAEPNIEGFYHTSLKSVVEISQGTSNKVVDRNAFPPTEDLCRTLRTDYYHSYRIDIPGHLQPGRYFMKVTLEDELSDKVTSETIEFEIR